MSPSATSRSPSSPVRARSASGCRNRWNIVANAPTGPLCLVRAGRRSPTAATSGQQRITGGKSVSYTITRQPGRAWPVPDRVLGAPPRCRSGSAARLLAAAGTTCTPPVRSSVSISTTGTWRCAASTRTATPSGQAGTYRHRPVRVHRHGGTPRSVTRSPGCSTTPAGTALRAIAVEDLDFADARSHRTRDHGPRPARETVPPHRVRDSRPRCSVNRLAAHGRHGRHRSCWRSIPPTAVSGATSTGAHPYENVTRHQAAATVIGRRAQGFRARRRKGVTHAATRGSRV